MNEVDTAVERVGAMLEGERPPGLDAAKRFLMLVDRETGRGLGVTFFDTEDDLRRGDEALNSMNPPAEESGRRTSVEIYEVGIDRSLG